MPELDSGAIDKVTDGRGEYVRARRGEWREGEDSEGLIRLCPSRHKRRNDIPRNGHKRRGPRRKMADRLFEFILIEILGTNGIGVVMTNEFEVIAIVIQFKLG